jgi:hypothetical protein
MYATSMKAEGCSHCTRKCKMYVYHEYMDGWIQKKSINTTAAEDGLP